MTGVGIIFSFLVFLGVIIYLTKKTYQNFRKFFYWLPFFTICIYVLGALTTFILEKGATPGGAVNFFQALSPYGYRFHFVGILLGAIISIGFFLKKIVRIESKKTWIDILFFGFSLSLVPLGIFLMLGDNFIGVADKSFLAIQSFHTESQLNKFSGVVPIGLFVSIGALISALVVWFLKITRKKLGYGMLGFALLLIALNITFLFQQYPRYGVVSIGSIVFDIKQYLSFFVIMRCLYVYDKWMREYHKSEAVNITKPIEQI